MKKLMIATALAAFCGAVMADGIESQNTVGYSQSQINEAGFCPVGVAFGNVDGGAFVVSNKLIGTTLHDDDQVFFLNVDNGDWDMYVFNSNDGWTAILSDGSMETGLATIPSINKGEGFYYLPADWTTPATVCGQVEASGSKSLVLQTQDGSDLMFQFVNPYPKATTFADFEGFLSNDDQVYILNTLNGDWDMYIFNGPGDWTTLLSDGTMGSINNTDNPGYLTQTFLEANRAAWVLPAWDWSAAFPQSRTFVSTLEY